MERGVEAAGNWPRRNFSIGKSSPAPMAGFFFCSATEAAVARAGIGVTHVLRRLSNSSAPLRTMGAFQDSGVGRG